MGDDYQSYFDTSVAYLQIGEVASQHNNMTNEYQNAIAYQFYHALELFVKFAILKNKGSVKPTHDLAKLFNEYYQLYQDDSYKIHHPFDFNSYGSSKYNTGEKNQYGKHINEFKPKIMDQHLRYPPDHKTGGYSFKIESDYFVSTKNKFLEIYSKINC